MGTKGERMNSPTDLSLPFFAYGLFRPGQIAYFQIREYVLDSIAGVTVKGHLLIRDGLPMIDSSGNGTVDGVLIHFKDGTALQAYNRIAKLEPDKQYRWDVTTAGDGSVNVLFGRSPRKGSVALEETDEKEWNGWNDPLFTDALVVVQETITANSTFEWDMKRLFRLQMAYLLLWSAIERYVSLRYHLAKDVTHKISHLADELAFVTALRSHVSKMRSVQRADNPTDKAILDPTLPRSALTYYYQVRSNITHRGKAMHNDFNIVLPSANELLAIFRNVLEQAKKDARS
jgi:hypothetical protein